MTSGRIVVAVGVAGFASLLMAQSVAHAGPKHTFTTVTAKTSAGKVCTKTNVNGLTNGGTVIGTAYCGKTFAFIRTPSGKTTTYRLPSKDGAYTSATNITSRGTLVVVGQATKHGAPTTYLVSKSGKLTRVRDPKAHGRGTILQSLNRHGVGVGYYCTNARCTKQHPIIFRRGKFTKVALPEVITKRLSLTAINDTGKVVGYYFDAHGVAHGIVIKGRKYHTFDAKKAGHTRRSGTYILGLASNGAICGDSVSGTLRLRGFVTAGRHISLVDRRPGQKNPQTEVVAINARGEFGGESHLPGHGTSIVGYLSRR